MTVMDTCRTQTQVGELVVIRDRGYEVAAAWIDCEDLFALPSSIADKEVTGTEWGVIDITTEHGDCVAVPCHYINIGDA